MEGPGAKIEADGHKSEDSGELDVEGPGVKIEEYWPEFGDSDWCEDRRILARVWRF